MRHVYSAAALAVALCGFEPQSGFGQGGTGLSITNYQLVSEERLTRTQWYDTYRADLLNLGVARTGVTATVTSLVPSVQVVAGQGTLHFPAVGPNGQVTSLDTFTILVDRSFTFDFSSLSWSFLNPVANAGPNQTAKIGATVTLNGSGSSNPSGTGTLTFAWKMAAAPASSTAVIANPTSVIASFVVDAPGTYTVSLTVSNGAASDTSTMLVSTVNSPPVANAGPNQTVALQSIVHLTGAASSDVDGDPLTYLWSLISRPSTSLAELSNVRAVNPTFVADMPGTYVAQLIVNDGTANSAPATVTITTANTPPVANAGPNQTVTVGKLVQLNGAGSTDVDGNPLTYKWTFNSVPAGSTAVLSNPAAVNPTFTADLPGTYIVQLIVNDGKIDSAPSTVSISTSTVQAPTANPGPNQTVVHGSLVSLNGSGADPQGLPLTFTWSLMTRPPGSVAVLSSATSQNPTFVADQPGLYVVQLVVSNGQLNSAPASVTITTTNTPPVANAGANANVFLGATVNLDGSNSFDADHDPLTYSWSFNSRPPGSSATLIGPTTKTPTFLTDAAGSYVVQLIVNDGFTNSLPATVTITASAMGITLTPSPLNLGNAPATLTITLGAPAGPSGLTVNLSGFNPATISVPSSVLVPANSTGANVTVTPLATGSTNILATATGYQPATVAVNVTAPSISMTFSLTAVGISRSITGTLTLNAPAPPAGTTVTLTADPPGSLTITPASVVFAPGESNKTFTVTGVVQGSSTVSAASPGYSGASQTLLVVLLGAIALPPNASVPFGQAAPLNVVLSQPAPVDGVTIALTSSDPGILTVSPTVFIAQGSTTPAVPAQATGLAFGQSTLTASATGFTGDSKVVKVTGSLNFTGQVASVGAGGVFSTDILLSAPAPTGGLLINLNSSNTAVATVPGNVTIAAGATSAPVDINALAPGSATITASTAAPNVAPGTLSLTVQVYGSISLPVGTSVGVGQSTAFPVTLSAPAPIGGATVTLSSANPALVDISPKTVVVATGQTQPSIQPQVTGVALGSAAILASAPGFGSASQIVQTAAALSFQPATLSLAGTETKTLTLKLSAPAPAGGLSVSLAVVPPGVVTVPASVLIPATATTVPVSVTGVAPGPATITATPGAPNILNATATATVQNSGGDITLPANVTVAPGQTLSFAVTLASPAAANTTVALSTNDLTKVTISPASVVIAAGQTQPNPQPQITGIDFGSATISAAATGYNPANQTVKVGATLLITPPAPIIIGTGTQVLTLTLSAPAPSDLTINLSAVPAGVITQPATATIAHNTTSTTITAKGVAAGSATLTASVAVPNVPPASAIVTVQSGGGISLQPVTGLGLGQSKPLLITLPAPAPAGGVTVNLSSSNPAKVALSTAAVTIDAGQTQPATAPQVIGKDVGSADITAAAALYASGVTTVQVTATIALTPASLTLSALETQNLTLTLSGPAPAGGISFNVSSSNTGAATVASSIVTIAANANSVPIPVTGVGTGSTIIRASAANFTDATANVTVGSSGDIIAPASLTIAPGDSVPYAVSLAKTYPSPVVLQFVSSDPGKAVPNPSSVTVQAGQTKPSSQATIDGIASGNATITVSSLGVTLSPVTTAVTVGYQLTLIPAAITIVGGGSQAAVTLQLSAPAPAGGITFNLTSSAPGVASVPSSVLMSQGSTSVGARINSISPGTTIVTASVAGIPSASATVTVLPPGAISVAAPASVGLSQTAPLTVTLLSPAPPGGVTVDLTSSDPTKLSISPQSVFFAGGSTIPSVVPQLQGVNVGSAAVVASALGYSSSTPVIVQVTASISWVSQNVTIVGAGNQAFLTLRLSVTAPLDGLTVNLTSSDPTVATIQATGIFIWDGSNAPGIILPVNSLHTGTTTIHASATNVPDVTTVVTVVDPLGISTTTLPNARVGAPYSATVNPTGGLPPFTWSATGLPAGLSIDSSTGVISGTPSGPGTTTVTVTLSDSSTPSPQTVMRDLQLTTDAGITITTAALPNGIAGSAYSAALAAVGGLQPYAWSATGLPAGFAIDPSTGAITGNPAAAGTGTVTVTVIDATSPTHQTSSKQFTLTIAAPLAITTGSLPPGSIGTAYSATIAASGGIQPYAWSATGLPSGFAINPATGAITGNPAAAFSGSVNVTVTDAASPVHQSASKQFTLTIGSDLAITTAALPAGSVGTPYNATVAATGGTQPYVWSATGLPSGFAIDPSTGAITGNPAAPSNSTVNVTVTDAATPTHQTATRQFTLSIITAPSITTTALPSGTTGTPYSFTVTATGGTQPYVWSATGLPAGFAIDPSTGTIAGNPAASSTSTVNVTVTDATSPTHLTAAKQFTLSIVTGLNITTTALSPGSVGTPYSFTVAASGGVPPYVWSATGLPSGFAIDPSTGAITGNPAAAGSSTVNVTVTDAANPTHQTASKQFTLSIITGPAISTTALPAGPAGSPYSFTVTAVGGTLPYTWSATGLPSGFAIDPSTGAIAGNPAAPSTSTVNVTLTDSTNPTHLTATKQLTLTIGPALSITTTALPSGPAGSPYSATVAATGGTLPYVWSATGLPAGFAIDPAGGAIAGNPSTTGTSTVNVTATDATSPTHQTASRQFTITITPGLSITTTALPSGPAGSPYSATVAATGGTAPYAWSATGLPSGFAIDPATGAISGNPSAAGTSTVNVTVTDATNPTHQSVTKSFTLTITPGVSITTSALPSGPAGSAYSAAVAATGGTLPYVWSATGLPAGFAIDPASGVISGTPNAPGSNTVNVTVTDATNPTHQTATKQFTLTIGPALAITTTVLPAGVTGSAYSATVAATGGTAPYTWLASGLPSGFAIDPATGVISGNPSVTSSGTVTVTATDSTNPTHQTASKQFTLTVVTPLSITTTSLPSKPAGNPYTATVAATGGTTPYTWSATGLPSGFSIAPTTGVISGNPTVGSTSTVTVTATDSTGPTALSVSKQLTLTITAGLSIATTALPNGTAGTPYSFTLTAAGGTAPYTWTSSDLPRSLVLGLNTGALTGTPLNAATTSIQFTVTDSSTPALQTTKTLSLTISIATLTILNTTLPDATVGAAYSTQMQASGGIGQYAWTANGLPGGITIDQNSGIVSGTSSVAGRYVVTFTVTDQAIPVPNTASAGLTLTVGFGTTGTITVAAANVGQNLQVPITITLSPAPPIAVTLTLTSNSPGLVLLGSQDVAGAGGLSATISANTTTVSTFVKAVGAVGNATITASIPGYLDGTGTVTVTQSGFVISGPNGIGGNFSTSQGASTTLTVYAARLGSNGVFAETQQLRGGFSVNVPVSSTVPNIGTVSTSSIAFSGPLQSTDITFTGSDPLTGTTGVTNVLVGTPFPFTTPAAGSALVVTVLPGQISPCNPSTGVNIGKNLQTTCNVALSSAATSATQVTITSADPSRLQFSTTPTGATSGSITLTVPIHQTSTPDFFMHAFDSTGSVNYTATAAGFGSVTSAVNLAPSGLVISTPFGAGVDFTLAVGVGDATLNIYTARLSGGSPVEFQAVASGITIPVAVSSGNTSVGTIVTSPVTVASGVAFAPTAFHPVGLGTSTLTASSAGYTSGTVHATVQSSTLVVCGGLPIGKFLQESCNLILPVAAGPNGVHVVLQSDSALLNLSASANAAGSQSIGIDIPAGANSAVYYIQSLGDTGSASYHASAPGFTNGLGSVDLVPSGIVILGQSFISLASGPQAMQVYTARLDAADNPVNPQALAGGASLSVTLHSSNTAVGTLPASVTILPGTNNSNATFTPKAVGTTTLSVDQPAGWTLPASLTQLGVIVQ